MPLHLEQHQASQLFVEWTDDKYSSNWNWESASPAFKHYNCSCVVLITTSIKLFNLYLMRPTLCIYSLTTLYFLKLLHSSTSLMPQFPIHSGNMGFLRVLIWVFFYPYSLLKSFYLTHVFTDNFKSLLIALTSHQNPTLLHLIMVIFIWMSPNTSNSVCPAYQPSITKPTLYPIHTHTCSSSRAPGPPLLIFLTCSIRPLGERIMEGLVAQI